MQLVSQSPGPTLSCDELGFVMRIIVDQHVGLVGDRGDHHDNEGDDHEQKTEGHDGDGHSAGDRLGHEVFDDRVQPDCDEQRHSDDDQDAGDV